MDRCVEDVRETGNLLRLQFIDGNHILIPNTDRNNVLYSDRVHEVLYEYEGDRAVLSEDPYIAVALHENPEQYYLWFGSAQPLACTESYPEDDVRVLEAIRDAAAGDPTPFKREWWRALDDVVRPFVVDAVYEEMPDSSASVITRRGDDGWEIHDLFVLTLDCDVYPVGGNVDGPGSFTIHAPVWDGADSIRVDGVEFTLTHQEKRFLSIAATLCGYTDHLRYDAYWENYERALEREEPTATTRTDVAKETEHTEVDSSSEDE